MNKKWLLYLLVFIVFITGITLATIYFKENPQRLTSVGNETEQKDEYIDFYKLYYSLAANQYTKTLTSSDIKKIKNEIESYGSKKLIENSVSIYDIWLYLEVMSLLELKPDNKELLLEYINNLYVENGFYKSYSEEEKNLEPQNYLLSTKMGLEAISNLGKELPNGKQKEISGWLTENFPNKLDKSDKLSYSDLYYVYLLILNRLEESSKMMNQNDLAYIDDSLKSENDSLIKYIVVTNVSLFDPNENLDIDVENMKENLMSLKQDNGGYPLFGDGNQELSDILSTYQVYYLFDFYNIEIDLDEKSHQFIRQNINDSMNSLVINGH
ncbi:hypothetical protein [Cytobacillus purgationiresistens]|uniref:Uncharacterized protein n=1 Tax=Cytobacillus purgationiresistens TaxID=863449 RepID=A0ABU0ARR4_9BACI|nr:hypothetical protein [Cytobacillus purgationiresistens]MDQ0273961.1 hypothetical protein [Cytobacillus purgationiresistens]